MQSRPQLLEIVWEAQPDIQTRTVDMHVQRLRTKLGDAGKLIETVRGLRLPVQGQRARGPEPVTFVRRLVLGSVLILVLAVAILLSVAERSLRRDLEGEIGRTLESEARLVREALPPDSTRLAGRRCASWRAQAGHRITLIDRDGWVRADSDFPVGPLPAHREPRGRPEVRAALATGRGRGPPPQRDCGPSVSVRRHPGGTGGGPGGGRSGPGR